eukprot:87027_1
MQKSNKHPYDVSNWWKRVTLLFHFRFMMAGYGKEWNIDDMSEAPNHIKITDNYDTSHNNVWTLLFDLNRELWLLSAVCYFGQIVFKMLNVFIFAALIDIVIHIHDTNSMMVAMYCVLFVFVDLMDQLFRQNFWIFSTFCALKTKNILMNLLLNKIMKVKMNESMGKVLNGISTDCDRLYLCIRYSACCIIAMVIVFASFPIFIYVIGLEVILGYVMLLVVLPLFSAYTANKQKQFMERGLKQSDQRLKLLNEMLIAIRIVKMYAWEAPLIHQIKSFRKNEIKHYKLAIFTKIVAFVLNNITQALVISVMIITRIFLLHKDIDLVSIYIMYMLIRVLKNPIGNFLDHFDKIIDGLVSIKRIQQIFDFDTIQLISFEIPKHQKNPIDIIQIQNINFQHTPDNTDHMLYDVHLNIKQGQLIGVVGHFASGKSCLLSSILGEKYISHKSNDGNEAFLRKHRDLVYGYVGHDYFIINATVRENIIMNQEFDAKLYDLAIGSCALKHDLTVLPSSHDTEIGEKGINISGGQKARICIARIVYRYLIHVRGESTSNYVILFDDPLSAVDSDVARHIFSNVILDLCSNATIIITLTSHLSLLNQLDRVIVMKTCDSRCFIDHDCVVNPATLRVLKAKYTALLQMENESENRSENEFIDNDIAKCQEQDVVSSHLLSSPLFCPHHNHLVSASEQSDETDDDDVEAQLRGDNKHELHDGSYPLLSPPPLSYPVVFYREQQKHVTSASEFDSDDDIEAQLLGSKNQKRNVVRLTTDEDRGKGEVNRSSLSAFINDGYGTVALSVIIVQYVLLDAIFIAFEYFINTWSSGTIYVAKNDALVLLIGFITSMILLDLLRSTLLFLGLVHSTATYSNKCLDKVLFAKIKYFDKNPNGRIVNRFSNDLKIMDLDLPVNSIKCARYLTLFITSTLVIVINIPYMIIPALLSMIVFYYLGQIYVCNSRELKRLGLITSSPIFAIFSEVCDGLITVRALQLETYFINRIVKQLELNATIMFNGVMSICWFYMLSKALLTLETMIVFILAIVLTSRGYLSPNMAVLCIVLQGSFGIFLQKIVLFACDTEINLTAVERLYHFYKIENEFDDYYYDSNRHVNTTFKKGSITLNDLTFKYRESMPTILQNISLNISAAQSIGVCGRTGAGKSSIFACLMRLFEVERKMIYIDGVDINDICLYDLRTNVSIIPQTPTIFSGTIRFNLDPFETYDDDDLINALKLCYLYPKYDLAFKTNQNGNNLSQGEKQLLCIARCIVRNAKILLLDESTSNIDHEYDVLIQRVIAHNFKHCTILTIAHRLNTIMSNDKILVLNDGRIQQFDTPANLLKDKAGMFHKLYIQCV